MKVNEDIPPLSVVTFLSASKQELPLGASRTLMKATQP